MERLSLEQLKAKSKDELCQMWWEGDFPFDHAAGCLNCLASHGVSNCVLTGHPEVVKNTAGLKPISFCEAGEELEQTLERYYALRLFYDHFYPQPEAPAEQLEAMRENEYDASANTR